LEVRLHLQIRECSADKKDNTLTCIEPSIFELRKLKSLCLMNNRISFIPDAIVQLVQLNSLWLKGNLITVVPETIAVLANLQYVYLESKIDACVCMLETWLKFAVNEIADIPSILTELGKLKELCLFGLFVLFVLDCSRKSVPASAA
jgi:Leucine-rich repeat (LRR) protein